MRKGGTSPRIKIQKATAHMSSSSSCIIIALTFLTSLIIIHASSTLPWNQKEHQVLLPIATNSSQHRFILTGGGQEHFSLFQNLVHIFNDEPKVTIYYEDHLDYNSRSLYYLPPAKRAVQCLSTISQQHTPQYYQDYTNWNISSVVSFINQQTLITFRMPDKSISRTGLLVNELQASRRKTTFTKSSCDTVSASSLTSHSFFTNYVAKNRPVVITNATLAWKTAKWTNAYLNSLVGTKNVHVKVAPGGIFEGSENISNWDSSIEVPDFVLEHLKTPERVVVRPASMEMKFAEFIATLDNNNSTTTSMYLEYLSISSYLKELQADAPEFTWASFMPLSVRNLWFGDGNTVGKLHFDPYENLLSMIAGKKTFVLFDPSKSRMLKEGHIREGMLSYDSKSDTFTRDTLLESTSMVNSPIDITESHDIESEALICTVSENETLYVPAFWWHEVRSAPESSEALRNLAVNFWYEPFYHKEFPCATCPLDINVKMYSEWLQKYGRIVNELTVN